MDFEAQQLTRLAELIRLSADTIRQILSVRDFDGHKRQLEDAADRLDEVSSTVSRIGHFGFVRPT